MDDGVFGCSGLRYRGDGRRGADRRHLGKLLSEIGEQLVPRLRRIFPVRILNIVARINSEMKLDCAMKDILHATRIASRDKFLTFVETCQYQVSSVAPNNNFSQ
jgi:hypothetical protein